MIRRHSLAAIAAAASLLAFASLAEAQTTQPPGTRSTPCDPLTPNNAVCLVITPATTMADGTPTVLPQTFDIEQSFNDGAWGATASGLTTPRYYAKNLPIGKYLFRVYQSCTPNCTRSPSTLSNAFNTTAPIVQPNPPGAVLVVQVTVTSDHSPVFRIVSSNGSPARGELYGQVAVGRECTGPVLFRWRGKSFRLVHVEPSELWGTTDASRLAAPCA